MPSAREERIREIVSRLPPGRDGGNFARKRPGLALGVLFLRQAEAEFEGEAGLLAATSARRTIDREDYIEHGVPYIPAEARFSNIIRKVRSDGRSGSIMNSAMDSIEAENENLRDALPGGYEQAGESELAVFLEYVAGLDMDRHRDVFREAYELITGGHYDRQCQE
jgi:hypothetical protein